MENIINKIKEFFTSMVPDFFNNTVSVFMKENYLWIELIAVALMLVFLVWLIISSNSKRKRLIQYKARCLEAEDQARHHAEISKSVFNDYKILNDALSENHEKVRVLTETVGKQEDSIFDLKQETENLNKTIEEKTAEIKNLETTILENELKINSLTSENADLKLLETENKSLLKIIARLDRIANPSALDDKNVDYLREIDHRLRRIESGKKNYNLLPDATLNEVKTIDDARALNRANRFRKAKLLGIKCSAIWSNDKLLAEIAKKL